MVKEKYESIVMEVIIFQTEDVIMTSPNGEYEDDIIGQGQ